MYSVQDVVYFVKDKLRMFFQRSGMKQRKGAFLTAIDNEHSNSIVINTIFDPQGRFLAFTMFDEDQGGDDEYIIRFGFGVKDSSYAD